MHAIITVESDSCYSVVGWKMFRRLLLTLCAVWSAFIRCSSENTAADSLIKRYETAAVGNASADDIARIAVDEDTGTVFAASRSAIYRLNEDLTVRSMRETESILSGIQDGGLCQNFSSFDDERPPVLALDPVWKRLLFCTSALCGLCTLVDADSEDLTSKGAVSLFDPSDELSFVGPSSRPYALFAGGTKGSSSAAKTTFGSSASAAASGNTSSSSAYLPAGAAIAYSDAAPPEKSILFLAGAQLPYGREILSARILPPAASSPTADHSPQLLRMLYRYGAGSVHHFRVTAKPQTERWSNNGIFRDELRRPFAFEDEGFVYFLTVRNISAKVMETRLARVCINDNGLKSFTELKLDCHEKAGIRNVLPVARTATVAPLGADAVKVLALADADANQRALYVIMEHHPNEAQEKSSHTFVTKSGLCVYRMATIRQEFIRAQRDCYGGNGLDLLTHIQRSKPKRQCLAQVSDLRLITFVILTLIMLMRIIC
jgi:Sema domain